jgi:4-amino-4-deoxy-L-arabinose transferase-like glycosyltransferase
MGGRPGELVDSAFALPGRAHAMTLSTASRADQPTGESPASRRELLTVLALFVLVWTLVPLFARWPAPIWDDTMEAWTWGQVPQHGYYKLPPFYAWIAGLWFRVLPPADWSGYLLPALNGAVGLLGLWHIARRFVSPSVRLVPVLLATTLPTATYMATLFNANTILLALWPWLLLAFLRTLETRRAIDGALLGLLAAAAMLSKYSSALLLASMLAAAILHPGRGAYFRSPAPYAAVVIGVLALLPHMLWLVASDFAPFKYAAGKVTGSTSRALFKASTVALTAIALAAPPALALVLATRAQAGSLLAGAWLSLVRPERCWFLVLVLGPLALTLLSGVLGGVRLAPNYLIPTLILAPVALIAAADEAIVERLRAGVRAFAIGYAALALLTAPAVAYCGMALQLRKFSDPVREAVGAAQELWRRHAFGPVRIVAGSELYALALAYYGPDRPVQFTHIDLKEAPWITPRRIASEGLLAVCVTGDPDCLRLAPYLSPRTIRISRTLQKSFLGRAGKPVALELIVIPPDADAAGATGSRRGRP